MEYIAYFDESYNQLQVDGTGPPPVYTIAGCVSTANQWAKFEKRWNQVLHKDVLPQWKELYGESSPPFFHMKEFDNPHDKLYGIWPESKRVGLLRELHSLMNKHCIKRFSTSIAHTDYDELGTEEKFVFGHPHAAAFVNCLKHIRTWANDINMQESIKYVFEAGCEHNKKLRQLHEETMSESEKIGYRIANLTFGDKRNLAPLQAADILAVESRREYVRRITPQNTRPVRKSALNLFRPTLDEWFFFDQTHFREILNRSDIQEGMSISGFSEVALLAKKKKQI